MTRDEQQERLVDLLRQVDTQQRCVRMNLMCEGFRVKRIKRTNYFNVTYANNHRGAGTRVKLQQYKQHLLRAGVYASYDGWMSLRVSFTAHVIREPALQKRWDTDLPAMYERVE